MAETMELEPFPPISTSPESTPASQRRSSGRSSPEIRVTAIDDEESELFRELHEDKDKPWWKTNFFIREPIRFGTWDGVFTSCILNIFGVVIFLRSGWMVGNAGLGLSALMIILTVGVALITTFSVSGLCSRVQVGPGGVYFVLSHVLGGRLGGVLGTLYVFGQAISISLYGIGLGEAVALAFGWDSTWAVRGIGFLTVTSLFVIVLAGVKFVIRLQLILLMIIGLSVLDFIIGSFSHTNEAAGFQGYKAELWKANQDPEFKDETFFTIFGVFFTTATGVMAGLNMSGDLRKPKTAITVGSTVAVVTSGFLYLLFAFVLAATCVRSDLREDYLLPSKVSLVGAIFIAGLFISSCSSILGAMFQAPRVFQSIAAENMSITPLRTIAKGRGPNKEPTVAVILIYVIAILFLFIGHVNDLAPIVTMFFLLTYAAVNYAFFALEMSPKGGRASYERIPDKATKSPSPDHVTETSEVSGGDQMADLFQLCEEKEEELSLQRQSQSPVTSSRSQSRPPFSVKYESNEDKVIMKLKGKHGEIPAQTCSLRLERLILFLVNRWAAFIGAIMSLLIMFLIHWGYALAVFTAASLLYIYILRANKGLSPGIADFSLFEWIKTWPQIFKRNKTVPQKQSILLPESPSSFPVSYTLVQLTKDSEDYLEREKRHRSVRGTTTFHTYPTTKVVTPTVGTKPTSK